MSHIKLEDFMSRTYCVLEDELSYRKSIQTLTSASCTSLDYIFLIGANIKIRSISGAEPQHYFAQSARCVKK